MRAANVVWTVLFLYAAGVQLNDPDPAPWILVYLSAALFCVVAAIRGAVPPRPTAAFAGLCAIGAVAQVVTGSGQSDPMGGFPHYGPLRDEVVREALGLALVTGWLSVLAFRSRKPRPDKHATG